MSLRGVSDTVFVGLQNAARDWAASSAPLDTHGAHSLPPLLLRGFDDIKSVVKDDSAFSISDLPAYLDAAANIGGTIDDRKLLLEKLITLMARLGTESEFGSRLQQSVIGILYKDLPHPPSGYLALPSPSHPPAGAKQTGDADTSDYTADKNREKSVNYAYRPADGSNYNPLMPSLGKAGSPYARSVPSQRCLSPAALPPADLVFDTLLKRDGFVEHPGGISSLFFAFADLVIHDAFNTDLTVKGWTKNKTSSYLDLSPLYGNSQEEVNKVRRNDGSGKLWDDVFADPRLIYMPPATCALLVLLSRNHNYVAEKILTINERGNFKNPPPSDLAACADQDEEIFQRARLVNTGYFIQIILRDYVGAILGLVRDGSSWRLDPLMNTRDIDHEVSPRGEGNVVSIEFNLLYRWHATASQPDTEWTEKLFANSMPGLDPKKMSIKDFVANARRTMNPGPDIQKWTFGGLKRDGSDGRGRFSDAELAHILQDATAASASAFKARGTPEILRVVELLSIEQGRAWGVCTLNEFRKFIGLKPYNSFREWNENENHEDAAEALYHDIDNLELYVGLQAEETKKPVSGAGLCPGYTISRAILADAVSLTRGDRFLTVDYTPFNLTTWGYDDCQANTSDGSYGGMLTKLLFRHLPDYYPTGSAYAHFPFLIPNKMRDFTKEHSGDIERKYNWHRPHLPVGPTAVAKTYSEVQRLFKEPWVYASNVAQRLDVLTGGVRLNFTPVEEIFARDEQLKKAAQAFSSITEGLIKQKTLKGVGTHVMYVDIVRDVINLVPVHWLSNYIIGLSLKVVENPRGVYREHELYSWFANIANYVYHNTDPSNDWFLREQSKAAADKILHDLKSHLARLTRGSANLESISDSMFRWVSGKGNHSESFLKVLVEATGSQSGPSALDGLGGSLFASVVPTAALFSQIIAQVVDFYLDEDKAVQREKIVQLAEEHSNAQVMPFIFEALRLDPPLSSILLTALSPTSVDGNPVARGQHVLASIIDANTDSAVFDNPYEPSYTRPPARVEDVLGLDRRGLLSDRLFEQVVPGILAQIFKLKHLRRQSTQSGRLTRLEEKTQDVPGRFYCDLNGRVTPFPVSLVVQVCRVFPPHLVAECSLTTKPHD
ncbi:heme peroxidase [Multifurca ochricompacta]|uniref:Heme peroxidase n=1 Tax=Multifurca ochricompacta TaxID=376703 RepID=A0AAD4LU34_9AGAM|nr:heme peroxidase [Multifurca ochricompacta]